jgi:hypothetical protein
VDADSRAFCERVGENRRVVAREEVRRVWSCSMRLRLSEGVWWYLALKVAITAFNYSIPNFNNCHYSLKSKISFFPTIMITLNINSFNSRTGKIAISLSSTVAQLK